MTAGPATAALARAAAPSCQGFDPACWTQQAVGNVVSSATSDALQQFVNDILEAYGKAIASLGSIWVDVPSPVVAAGGGGGTITAPPGSESLTTLLGWVVWVSAGIAIVSLITAGVMMAARRRHGDGEAHLGRVGVILLSVILTSAASALVAGFLPQTLAGNQAGSVAGWVQDQLAWYTAGLAVLSILIAAARMAWTQRAMPLKELAGSVLTLIAVAGAGLVAIRLATSAADSFSVWVLNGSTNCSVSGDGTCFGRNLAALITLTSTSPIGEIGLFLLGLLAVLMTYVQVALMVLRGAMLVLLAGVLPITASFTNIAVGRQWFGKALAWTIAFILYKPAAAIVYATAFRLTGSNAFQAGGAGLFQILTGLALMLVALIALPALMRFLVPAVAAIGGSASGGLLLAGAGAAGAGEVATGAIRANRTTGGGPSSGATGGPSGSAQAAGRSGGAAAGSGSAAAGGSAAGGAAAAAGPVGIGIAAAGAVAGGAVKAAGAAGTAVKDATEDSTGSGSKGTP